jgi:putative ABC transport system permease protein
MLTNFIKIAFRNIARNKTSAFINIFGLAVGLATCFLIMLYIFDESSYDQHHKDGDRTYRIASISGKANDTWAAAPGPIAHALKNELPEVEQTTRILTFSDISKMVIKYGEGSNRKQFLESNGYYVDSTFFQLFTYDFKYGNALTALNKPNTIVISEQIAQRFFGNVNPVDKAMLINTPFGEFNYTVKGVFDNTSHKSHIPANYFLSMNNQDMGTWAAKQTKWTANNVFFTYVKLKEGTDPERFQQKLNTFFISHAGADMKAAGFSKTLFIQALPEIYLHSDIGNEIAANGSITYLYILGSIAAFILLIACINFMNLSTARSQKRAKEVGVRKVLGAEKGSLIKQFIGESFLMCFISLAIALLMALILLPTFNSLTGKELQLFDIPELAGWILGLTIITGLLAGFYPAFYLSAFRPIAVLKGKIGNNFSATAVRKGLVIFQFAVSVCLLLGSIVIWQQMRLVKNKHLGFTKDQQIVFPLTLGYNNTESNYTALKSELLKNPSIRSVTSGAAYPGISNLTAMLFYPEGKTVSDVVSLHLCAIDKEYLETLGFKLLHGRTFSKDLAEDAGSLVLNETAVNQLGFKAAEAPGKKLNFDNNGTPVTMQIIGVVKDFNFESLHKKIEPYAFTAGAFGNKYTYVIASITQNNRDGLLPAVERSWKKAMPNAPFLYSFLDQDFQRNYEKEQRTSRIVLNFTIVAILIACLGLFGLAIFSAEQRTREIGIRKVLGASVFNVTLLLSKDFIRLVLLSIVIASPVAWYVMNQWLEDFAYRVSINWWMFAAAGMLAVFIALVTVSFQSIKAAMANPVNSLRSE